VPSTPFTTTDDLAKYKTIIFASPVDNTNNLDPNRPRLLDDTELAAFQGYLRAGGGIVGIHAATDTMYTVPWYSELTRGGARFRNHTAQQTATMLVESPAHPSTEHLPAAGTRFDEWYNFTANPGADVHVLATLDESTYNQGSGAMGDDHPLAWSTTSRAPAPGTRAPAIPRRPSPTRSSSGTYSAGSSGPRASRTAAATASRSARSTGSSRGLEIDSTRTEVAVRLVSSRLDRAEAASDSGDRELALEELHVAGTLAGAMGQDRYTARVLKTKIGDLADWQQGLLDNEM
jgi:hypothetical protein